MDSELRRQERAEDRRALRRAQRFPLTGDGANAPRFYQSKPRLFMPTLRGFRDIVLADARYLDWLDQRRAAMPKTTKKTLPDILVDAGLVPNHYLLDTNHCLHAPEQDRIGDPWDLPSRLMRFPLEVNLGKDGHWHIGLMHPELADHPFVKRVAAAIKPYRIAKDGAPNASGFTATGAALWHHAVDLIGHDWRVLLRTRRFTTDDEIIRAVTYALDHYQLSPGEARELLAAVEAPPPDAMDALKLLLEPAPVEPHGQPAYWPINSTFTKELAPLAWIRLWGVEAGWFDYSRKKHLGWTPHGIDMYGRLFAPPQHEYLCTYVLPGQEGRLAFKCWAEDAEHAVDQLFAAEPKALGQFCEIYSRQEEAAEPAASPYRGPALDRLMKYLDGDPENGNAAHQPGEGESGVPATPASIATETADPLPQGSETT